jgi:hypothetical protein
MSEQGIIGDYLHGRIGPWAFYRRLVKVGVSVNTALALALGLPAVVRGEQTLDDLASRAKQTRGDDSFELERLLAMIGNALLPALQAGNLNPLAVGLAKLGVNVDVPVGTEGVELSLQSTAGNVPVNLGGILLNLGAQGDLRNMNLVLNGSLGQIPVNLAGNVDAPVGHAPGLELGKANLNFLGNAGNVPLSFSGNIGNVLPPPVTP